MRCRTFGTRERIRVPSPAASTTSSAGRGSLTRSPVVGAAGATRPTFSPAPAGYPPAGRAAGGCLPGPLRRQDSNLDLTGPKPAEFPITPRRNAIPVRLLRSGRPTIVGVRRGRPAAGHPHPGGRPPQECPGRGRQRYGEATRRGEVVDEGVRFARPARVGLPW